MRMIDRFKDLMFGFGLFLCLLLVPVELMMLRTTPVLLQYLSPLGFAVIVILSLVVSVALAFFGIRVIRHSLKKYVQSVILGIKRYQKYYNKNEIVRNAASKLNNQIHNKKNQGFGQARNLLDVIYIICRNPLTGISYRKLNKYFKIVKDACPLVLEIGVEIWYGPTDFYDISQPIESEVLVIRYYFGSDVLTEKRLIVVLK